MVSEIQTKRGRKKQGRHPERALSAAFVRTVTKPGRYGDGAGPGAVGHTNRSTLPGATPDGLPGADGSWVWAAIESSRWRRPGKRRWRISAWPAKHAAEPLGEAFGVTMVTAARDLGTACYGIPGGVRPFDCRFIAHGNNSARNTSPRISWCDLGASGQRTHSILKERRI